MSFPFFVCLTAFPILMRNFSKLEQKIEIFQNGIPFIMIFEIFGKIKSGFLFESSGITKAGKSIYFRS